MGLARNCETFLFYLNSKKKMSMSFKNVYKDDRFYGYFYFYYFMKS